MKLYLYNTMTRQKEEFVPTIPGKASMYSCGPTVYSSPQIGNLRATFSADLIRNTLKLLGYEVTAVMNITDVGHLVSDADEGEDKMEKGSRREGTSAREIAKKYESIFRKDMKKLNIDEFDVMPRATDHIKEQIVLIQSLESKGYTYIIPGDGIYMDTSKVEDYGKLMGPNYKKRLADLNAGERVDMKGKKRATDFALWKFSPEGEKRQMERDSPRGLGFPGWHIECSAMSSKYLGEQFDIHHGGADHITIHHPNEIAQSECAFGKKPWVKYRIHNEFLQVDGGKMGKSLGNAYTLEDIKARGYSPLDLRYFYFMAQYDSFQNFTWQALEAAKNARKSLIKKLNGKYTTFQNPHQFDFYKKIEAVICDNINAPKLLAEINTGLNSDILGTFEVISYLEDHFLKLGLFEQQDVVEIPSDITELAEQRKQSKLDKNYALADELRNKIKELGYDLKDTKDGYEISKI